MASAWLAHALILLSGALLPLQPSIAADEYPRGVDYFVGAGVLYDDNLFRQPSSAQLTPGILGLHRDDLVERLSAGVQGSWTLARQRFELNAHADDNRFEHNDQLNNVSANAKATWDWQFGSRWSGRLGADYSRLMADFANNLILEKDLLTQRGSFAGASYLLGTRWVLNADVRWASTTHSAEIRRVENDDIRTQKFGLEFRLSPTDSLGWNYQHSNANYSADPLSNTDLYSRNFDESASVFWLKYALGGKTDLNVQGGYLRRNYQNAAIGSYSGGTGRATLKWHPGAKTEIALTGWRDLTAYADAESNYFVTTGARIAPMWTPTDRITTSIAAAWERQNYIGSDATVFDDPMRHDTVRSAQLNAIYVPRSALELDLTYRREQRSSNRSSLTYVDNLAMLGIRVTF
jgi:exopolysaccharide biosynthesis operon protein EpsL